ncbi:cytochrome c [Azonexus sp. IMCC34842]|uniref:cytochrome c n=1 Tax=Azonexus sp. IMCC34842 TaxID=3420950 RepID=UPI003D131251
MRLLTATFLALTPFVAQAEEPWGKVDLQAAKSLHDKACISCHTRMYGGDGSKMYTRDGRMLSNKLELVQRVASCNAMVSSGWFPEEENNVAAWLNQQYYHFEN